jgi:16S rRNA G966 N2-methylase RsmD
MRSKNSPIKMPKATPLHLHKELEGLCREAFKTVIIDPRVKILEISVESVFSPRFDSRTEKLLLIVHVKTNDAAILRGDQNSFKGSYKERVEGILDFHAKRIIDSSEVYLDIDGPDELSVQRLIPVSEFLESGQLSDKSPIIETAHSFSIPYILIRGRHFIAPSPAIAQYLKNILANSTFKVKRVLDMFGGTGLAAKILCKLGEPDRIVVIERDFEALQKMNEHIRDPRVEIIQGDAFTYKIEESFDLVLADPYYEDVLAFLEQRLMHIFARTKLLMLVPGNVGNVRWNNEVEKMLAIARLIVRKYTAFGQVILEVSQ